MTDIEKLHLQHFFACATLAFALAGLVGTYISTLWAKVSLPPEPTPGVFLTGAERISYHSAQEANRYRFFTMSLAAARTSNVLLFTAVVTALTVNFPLLWALGAMLSVITLTASFIQVIVGLRESKTARSAFRRLQTAHRDKYAEQIPDNAGLRSEGE